MGISYSYSYFSSFIENLCYWPKLVRNLELKENNIYFSISFFFYWEKSENGVLTISWPNATKWFRATKVKEFPCL